MSEKHTQGPWKLILHGNEKYPYPLSMHTQDDAIWIASDGRVSSLANAHLIAAAPDLLAALESAVEWDSHDDEGEPAVWLEQARAAIAKARGL